MKAFKTTDGTEWKVTVNVGTIKRVQDDTGLRLTDLFASPEKISEFFSDDVKFCEVLFSVVRPQAEADGKGVDDFLSSIDGTVIEGAVEALLEEVADFFHEPRKGLIKKTLAKYRAAHDRLVTEGVLAVEQKINQTDFETLLRQTLTSSPLSSPGSAA